MGNILPFRAPSYYGWWIVFGSAGALSVSSGVSFWAFGLFIDPLEEEFGWSRTQVTGAISLAWLVTGLLGPLVGIWVDRYGARSAMLLGSIPLGLSYFLLAGIDSLWQLYALYFLSSVFRAWMFYIPIQALVSRWFSQRRGQALGIATSGFGFGGFIFTPLLIFIIEQWGWRQAYAFSGVAVLAYFVPVTLFLIRNRPEDIGAREPEAPQTAPAAVEEVPWSESSTLGQALRTRSFWLLAMALNLMFMAQLSFLIHAVPFFRSEGISAGVAAALVAAMTALYTSLRLAFGFLADRVPARTIAIAMTLFQAGTLSLIIFSTAPPVLALFVLLWAIGQAGGPIVEPLLISRTFGVAHFGAILGALGFVYTTGQVAGPLIGGWLFDVTGNYDAAFLVYIASLLLAATCYALFAPPRRREATAPAALD